MGEPSVSETVAKDNQLATAIHRHTKTISAPLILKSAKQVYPDGEEVAIDVKGFGSSIAFSRAIINQDTVWVGQLRASYLRELDDPNDTGTVSYSFRGKAVERI
jgi:hypothetical protein